jgi:hypothetical protein
VLVVQMHATQVLHLLWHAGHASTTITEDQHD